MPLGMPPIIVEWPATAFASADAPLVLCILGKDPFDGALDQIATGKTIKRIEVNPSSAARGHLKVSSKLLQLAIIAGGAPHGK